MGRTTITGILESVKETMCDKYCKYSEIISKDTNDVDYEKHLEEYCENCPLNLL